MTATESDEQNLEVIHPRLENAMDAILDLYDRKANNNVVALQIHSNGLPRKGSPLPSVLGISAARFTLEPVVGFDKAEKYERLYFPVEPYNTEAIESSGLNQDFLQQKRKGQSYPKYFDEDGKSFSEFCGDASIFLGFNMCFFPKYLPWLDKKNPKPVLFDLMKRNTNIVCSQWNASKGEWQWPSFQQMVWYYFSEPSDSHRGQTMHKVEMMMRVFEKMQQKVEDAISDERIENGQTY